MKKFLRGIWSVCEVVIILYVIVVTAFILCKNKYGYTQIGDYTFDNVSLIDARNIEDANKGDLLIVRNSNNIHVGDRIYYYAAYNESYIVRSDYVLSLESDDFSALYTIQRNGENMVVPSARLLGKYSTIYKKVGSILEVLESRIGFLFLVLLPIMIVFIYQVYEFVVILRYEEVEADEDSSSEKKPTKVEKVEKEEKKEEEKKEEEEKEEDSVEVL